MAEIKNENATINNGADANNNPNPDQNKAEKQPGKVKAFFTKHSGKIKAGLLVVGGVAAGVVADKVGIRLGGKKKDDDTPATEADV